MFNTIHEECGVFGIFSKTPDEVASDAYYALFALQHRGQESCGIAVNDDGIITLHKDSGLVGEVFTDRVIKSLGNGNMAIAHTRYGTTNQNGRENAQPMLVNHIKGPMAICHNGNLTNSTELRQQLELGGSIFHSKSDTEVISYLITKERLSSPSIENAVFNAMYKLSGAYSLIIMSPSKLIACRDPQGFRPLCMGTRNGQTVFASETCALNTIGAKFVRDIEPGEIVVVDKYGERSIKGHCGNNKKSLCVFEYVYFARPDSVVEGQNIHDARMQAGRFLAMEHPVDADVVIGVPDSGISAAMGYSEVSKIPYGMGFLKNKYIGRSFIRPTQEARSKDVRIKLNVIKSTVAGKRVIMIDDSIVRGTTCARIVNLLRSAGAKEVHVRISAPPFKFPCYFGTDIDSKENLIANENSIDEINKIIGADSLGYLSNKNLLKVAPRCKLDYCDACFTGNYPVEPPKSEGELKFEKRISEKVGV